MAGAARLGDAIQGTAGEHSGHLVPHSPVVISGSISGNCSNNVYINDKQAATIGSITTETDSCCGGSTGTIAVGSNKVFINGKAAARIGDALSPHTGTAKIIEGSNNVIIA
jgi:uncharacterized Zn-binding protein involved in type VI secretion